jgi:hypothetical protein
MFEITGYKQLWMNKFSPLQKMRTGYLSLLIPISGPSLLYGGKVNLPIAESKSMTSDRILSSWLTAPD